MAHKLEPKDGAYLSPREVVRRLRIEFSALKPSREQGAEHVRDMLTYLLRLRTIGSIPVEEERLARVAAAESESIGLFIADDPYAEQEYLQCCVMPDEPLFIDYTSAQHEKAARPILERCATALGYKVVLL